MEKQRNILFLVGGTLLAAIGILGYASSFETAVRIAEGQIETDSLGRVASTASSLNSLIVTAIGGTGVVVGAARLLSRN